MNHLSALRRRAIRWLLGISCVLTATAGAHAGTCSYGNGNSYGNGPATLVAPLNVGALTIGRDVPDGTVLYRQTVTPIQPMEVVCTNPSGITTLTRRMWLTNMPLPLSSWNGNPYGGHVYQTGVPGIGIAFWRAGNPFPYSYDLTNCGGIDGNCTWSVITMPFDISLIKIGPVSPGTIDGANLPSMEHDVVTDNVLPLMRVSFSGSIRIVAQTCTTPDVNVDMGQHQTKVFSGAGSATPWKDFSILLQNCPAFTGSSSYVQNNDSATGWNSSVATNPNTIGFSLAPTTPIVDPAQGIVALAPTSSGPAAATGVGLQVANASNAPVAYNTVMPSGIVPSATSGASYSIPLRARYVQTGSAAPTPGPANTSMMFTINYQ